MNIVRTGLNLVNCVAFHETAAVVNNNLQPWLPYAFFMDQSGPMQESFRVEVWRCHLSHELQSSQSTAQSPAIRVHNATSLIMQQDLYC